jgi:ceramide glucosyltransferase
MLLTAKVGSPCVLGKSMFFKKTTLARFGGLDTLSHFIAEDYMAGQGIRQLGLKVKIHLKPIPQFIGRHSLNDFWKRHVRWSRIRKSQNLFAYLFEPLTGLAFTTLGALIGISAFSHFSLLQILFMQLGLWLACDVVQFVTLIPKLTFAQVSRLLLFTPFIWLLRELLAWPLWIHTGLGNSVQWRGRTLFLNPGGIIESQTQN